jgi:hypothetical protein
VGEELSRDRPGRSISSKGSRSSAVVPSDQGALSA